MSAVRSCIFSAKCLQDIRTDIIHLSKSANEIKYGFYLQYRQFAEDIFHKVSEIILSENGCNTVELVEVYQVTSRNNIAVLNKLYHRDASSKLSEIEISTVFNFNRELSNALESLVQSAKFIKLDQKEQETFDTLVEAKMS